jgi:hypothetical protein
VTRGVSFPQGCDSRRRWLAEWAQASMPTIRWYRSHTVGRCQQESATAAVRHPVRPVFLLEAARACNRFPSSTFEDPYRDHGGDVIDAERTLLANQLSLARALNSPKTLRLACDEPLR